MSSSPLLMGQSLSKSFGSRPLFKNLSLSLFPKEKVGLLGPNGSGKSTLLKILADIETPDSGNVAKKKGLKIGYVPQQAEFPQLKPEIFLLNSLSHDTHTPEYEKIRLVHMWLSKLGLPLEETTACHLSGGQQKRLKIAEAMLKNPDILLLDEPTNHLDLDSILFLETFLQKEAPSYLLVSHDRYFLQNMVERVIEINSVYPEGIFSVSGDYQNFLEKKELFLKGQKEQERSIASKARREQAWLRETPKARTTKADSRVKEAEEILTSLTEIQKRNREKKATLDFTSSERQTKKLLVAKNISMKLGEKLLFQKLDFTLSPGTRLGLMGPNGSGKTTLLRLLANEITPDQGTIKTAQDLKIVYFDQHRAKLPLDITLKEALSPNGEWVYFRGQQIHVNGWCKRFLFSPEHMDLPLSKLSGGERARIAIAHLMLQPADLLLLDEPTNDLDIETLETLEESLMDFPGAVVLITHDRFMLDRIANVFLALGGNHSTELYADYNQWKNARDKSEAPKKEKEKETREKKSSLPKPGLSYHEKREWQQMEQKIAEKESEIQELAGKVMDPEIACDTQQLSAACDALHLAETELERLFLRWETLDKKNSEALSD